MKQMNNVKQDLLSRSWLDSPFKIQYNIHLHFQQQELNMGTRSRIGVMHGDKIKSVYCHWDGYLSHNGRMLQEYYDSAKANYLVALGDVSSLQPNVVIPEGVAHSFDEPAEDITIFYSRDRKEENTEFKVALTFAEFLEQCNNCDAEYYYLMRDGVWYCGDTYGSTDISNKIAVLSEQLVQLVNE